MRISIATAYGIILFLVLMIFELKSRLPGININSSLGYISDLGIRIFSGGYFIIMIVLSVLILTSMVGAFYLSGRDDEE